MPRRSWSALVRRQRPAPMPRTLGAGPPQGDPPRLCGGPEPRRARRPPWRAARHHEILDPPLPHRASGVHAMTPEHDRLAAEYRHRPAGRRRAAQSRAPRRKRPRLPRRRGRNGRPGYRSSTQRQRPSLPGDELWDRIEAGLDREPAPLQVAGSNACRAPEPAHRVCGTLALAAVLAHRRACRRFRVPSAGDRRGHARHARGAASPC